MNAESNTWRFSPDSSQTNLRSGRLRWKRLWLLTWPALVSLSFAFYFYFTEFHATLSWLIQNRHPMNDWMSYFELDNQILPLFFLVLVTLLMLFQMRIGVILFLLGTFMFSSIAGISIISHFVYYCIFDPPSTPNLLLYWIIFILGLVLSTGMLVSLIKVDDIDQELKRLKENC